MGKNEEMGKMAKIGEMGKMGEMGGSAKMVKNAQNAKIPKNGLFGEIPQNWDFGDYDNEHTRKAWCDNYFKNNPWVPILHTSIEGVYFTLFINHWFSVSFIFDYFYRLKENVIK